MMTTPRPERGAGICACAFIGEPWLTFGCATCGLRGAWPARRKCAVLHAIWRRRLHASRRHRLHAKPTCRSTEPERPLVPTLKSHTTALGLQPCGDNLTRDNLLAQATSLNKERVHMLLPEIDLTDSKENYGPFRTWNLLD